MEIRYITDGFEIVHQNKVLFRQTHSPTGGPWDQAEREALANEVYNNYLISSVKEPYKNKIRQKFEEVIKEPVTDPAGIMWHGGFESALKLDAAKRLAETVNMTTVTFFDYNNTAHTLTIAEATNVVLYVAQDYQQKLARKHELLAQVDAAPDEASVYAIDITF